jgi:hypothetical protein
MLNTHAKAGVILFEKEIALIYNKMSGEVYVFIYRYTYFIKNKRNLR